MAVPWPGRFDGLFLGGKWVPPTTTDRIEVISPRTGEVLTTVPSSNRRDVDLAVGASRDALDNGPWPRMPLGERIALFRRVRGLISDRSELFAQVITAEMGAPIAQSRAIQVGTPLALLDAYTKIAETFPFEERRLSSVGTSLITRRPIGVVAAVVPWNVPLTVTLQKVLPALLSGCTMVLKPAPETPLSAYLLAEVMTEAGLPPGVLNIVTADREASEYLVSHPGVNKVTFTGSTGAGRRIASICGGNLVPVTLELGGKSAAIILDDADLETTVESLRMGSLRNSGQVCSLKTRLLVSGGRKDEFLDRLATMVESMPVGDPLEEKTQIGPMVSERHRDTVQGYIDIALHEGARAVVGGTAATPDRGWFVEPTVFADVEPGMRIAQEEVFGPVLAVLTYDTEEEAIAIANNSAYGLNGAVFSNDVEHALRVADQIHTGTVEINGNGVGPFAPIGGVKASGLGREGGPEAFEPYLEIKSVGLPRDYFAG